MATLRDDVLRHLDHSGTRAILIGADAMALHGIVRATVDTDLMTVSKEVLSREFWEPLDNRAAIEVRRGDYDDPLAGVVRLRHPEEKRVDVVVMKHRFAAEIIDRARLVNEVRVAQLPDIVLLKLFAGGPQDAWDIAQVLASADAALITEIESRLPTLPHDVRSLWERIRAER